MTLHTPVDTVVFDLGGVLIDWNPRYLYRKLFVGDEAGMERFLAEVCSQDWNECQDAGRSWAEGIAEAVARHPQHEPLIRAYRERWEEMLAGPLHDSVALLERLHAHGVRLLALTNWSAETFPLARRLFPFLGRFEGILVSGDEGLKKPDPAIFRLLVARYALQPERSLFIDDSPRNVAAASALGFRALRFTDAEALRAALLAHGLPAH